MFKDWQKGQVFIHILKKWVKALEYKALTHFLPTFLSTMPYNEQFEMTSGRNLQKICRFRPLFYA
ncbi:hypothetical protein [Actinobacillus ureae]|uniref:hypothetical protein n=1 Tax=Actinobacillus ureae TaxID=723 RepID=UPI0011C04A2B|nr:hypothetical protein [Actinobacillus ureae]